MTFKKPRRWTQDPFQITQINPVPILNTTVKAIKLIAADYEQTKFRPKWGTTLFNKLIVVARVLQLGEQIVITDNTDVLIHEERQRPIQKKLFFRDKYYRFGFFITPNTPNCLSIFSIQQVTPSQVRLHIAQSVKEELLRQMHQRIYDQVSSGEMQEVKVDSAKKRQQILEVIGKVQRFTVADIQKEVDWQKRLMVDFLGTLCGKGKIGDLGNEYIVIDENFGNEYIVTEENDD